MGAIYLVRHGQASFGAANYDQLSTLGVEQSRVLGASLRTRLTGARVVVCGAMKRHQQTAEHCLAAMGLQANWDEDAGLNEYDHVEIVDRHMDRRAFGAALNAAQDRMKAFEELFLGAIRRWQSGEHDAQYREPWPLYRDRCLASIERLAQRLAPAQTALVFTSGGVITTVAQTLLGFPLENFAALNWRLANAGLSKLVVGASGRFLSTLNEHGHFEGSQAGLLTYR